jgi:S1-C subfamily serine protease
MIRRLSPFRLIDSMFERFPALARRKGIVQLCFSALLGAGIALSVNYSFQKPQQRLSQEDIDKAVAHALSSATLPSQAARAAEIIAPSVVRVNGFSSQRDTAKDPIRFEEQGVGSGVLIVETGLILTNLHVVQRSEKIVVVFQNGHESEATIVSIQPEQDIAVLQVKTLPDDPKPATMRGTGDLAPGDLVVAVGFPFGIGPSVSAGVVSGLKREFQSQEGKRTLTNLIQFDAAANPGNSGGPLVTAEGEVVGIVTGILNPSGARVFAGISFAVPIESATAGMGISPF